MKTTYEFTSVDGKPVYCPFTKLLHLVRGPNPGHLLVFDDENRVLTFLHARTKLGVAGNVFLTSDADLKAAKDWIAEQVAMSHLAQIGTDATPPVTVGQASPSIGAGPSRAPAKTVATEPPQDSADKKTAGAGL